MIRLAIPLLVLASATTAFARPICVEFEARVTEVFDHFDVLPDVGLGIIITGSYLYDDTFPNNSNVDSIGRFESAGFKMVGFEFEMGGRHSNSGTVQVQTSRLRSVCSTRSLALPRR